VASYHHRQAWQSPILFFPAQFLAHPTGFLHHFASFGGQKLFICCKKIPAESAIGTDSGCGGQMKSLLLA